MELIVGNTRLSPVDMQLTEEGVVAEVSGAELASVLNATHGGRISVELFGEGMPARPMSVAEIRMHGASSTVTLHYAGEAVVLN
ncbi:hypothetical protein [Pseudooceanicola spongiae]|jgi:hypothetical protein|uniref:Uncharacterized protein n=1 Tax=Pseudooceanicola spongiae TaxID=2613965 RepID=A0A7L9WJZ5_9RHOB|nr:hypothetical protein [Pseudooceanicola spongiae]QOL79878.1 hypothetical protein F3W81_03000 [Pseudooceanicola spongiae]